MSEDKEPSASRDCFLTVPKYAQKSSIPFIDISQPHAYPGGFEEHARTMASSMGSSKRPSFSPSISGYAQGKRMVNARPAIIYPIVDGIIIPSASGIRREGLVSTTSMENFDMSSIQDCSEDNDSVVQRPQTPQKLISSTIDATPPTPLCRDPQRNLIITSDKPLLVPRNETHKGVEHGAEAIRAVGGQFNYRELPPNRIPRR
jgi:hypothetical protein